LEIRPRYGLKTLTGVETFEFDLFEGESSEREVLKYIHHKYPKAFKIEGYFKEYDIYVPEVDKSVEVKQDYKSQFTGNLVVEIEFNGKPSALSTTKADYWVFVTMSMWFWITPKQICECIREYKYTPATFVGKGDTKSKKAYLIKINHIENFSEWTQKIK